MPTRFYLRVTYANPYQEDRGKRLRNSPVRPARPYECDGWWEAVYEDAAKRMRSAGGVVATHDELYPDPLMQPIDDGCESISVAPAMDRHF